MYLLAKPFASTPEQGADSLIWLALFGGGSVVMVEKEKGEFYAIESISFLWRINVGRKITKRHRARCRGQTRRLSGASIVVQCSRKCSEPYGA